MNALPVVSASGTPYAIGRATGTAVAERIRAAARLIGDVGLATEVVGERLASLVRSLENVAPDALDEARGVADGAGIATDEALLLSFAPEINGRLPGYCSLLAVPGPDGPLLGKNLDVPETMGPLQVVQHVDPHDGFAYTHLTTAGALWTDGGVNEAGLALVNASLAAEVTIDDGIPDGYLVRQALARCASVEDAVGYLTGVSARSAGENVLVADGTGRTALVQILPGCTASATDLPLPAIACNRGVDPRVRAAQPADDPIRANSERRETALAAALARVRVWNEDSIFSVLGGGGVRLEGADDLWSVATIAIDPARRRLESLVRTPSGARAVHWRGAPLAVRETEEVGQHD